MSTKVHSWFKPRTYLHFDNPIGYKKAKKIVTNIDVVAQHSFYPFLQFTIKTSKISKEKISKKITRENKPREISYASHLDSQIYAYYAEQLSKLYEEELTQLGLDENILAFRKIGDGKCNIHFAHDAFEKIKSIGPSNVVAMDFEKFFDSLDHRILKERWSALLGTTKLPADHFNVYKSLTKFATVNRDELYKNLGISKHNPKHNRYRICSADEFRNKVRIGYKLIKTNTDLYGIPQGSPISALLSNIYLIEFDKAVKAYADSCGGTYYRYCDDILFIAPAMVGISTIENFVTGEANKARVKINSKKTVPHEFKYSSGRLETKKPLQYLGFLFDGKNTYLRSGSLSRFSERMKIKVRLAKKTRAKCNQERESKGFPKTEIFKKDIYSRCTHLGRRNFIRYGHRAAKIMSSRTIRKQLKPLWNRVQDEINRP
ncbi:MAG: group II intron reverse transcriptase domain-containing protein [Thiotrichales bacterium]|nr:group II intron reverse transcriptase domain-containing protein [Thiotrichales bacterium]